VQLNGTANDDKDDQGYVVEIAIPFASVAHADAKVAAPTAATSWRANFFVMNATGKTMRAAAFSSTQKPDFHTPERFGVLLFSDKVPQATEAKDDKAEKNSKTANIAEVKKAPSKAASKPSAPAVTPPKEPSP
jgi:hypothetical protein